MSQGHYRDYEPIAVVAKSNCCPECNRRFSDWFFWPGKGNYCWPCYRKTRRIIVRKEPVSDGAH